MFENYDMSWAELHENPIDVGLDSDETLLVYFSSLRGATAGWTPDAKPSWGTFHDAKRSYQAFRLELGRDLMATAWKLAKAGTPSLAPLRAFSAGYRQIYRGSAAQKRHQEKYQAKPEIKARRAAAARNRRAARKAARS